MSTAGRRELIGEHRAIVIAALTDELIWQSSTATQSKATMHYLMGLQSYRHRLMVEQLEAQAAETQRLNGLLNHPPRDLSEGTP